MTSELRAQGSGSSLSAFSIWSGHCVRGNPVSFLCLVMSKVEIRLELSSRAAVGME